VLVAEGEAWRAKRHALLPAFAAKAVHGFVPAMAHAAADAFAGWRVDEDAGDWPIQSALTSLSMDIILRMMFSSAIAGDVRRTEQAVHDALASANAELYWAASWPDWAPWKLKKRRALAHLNRQIDSHVRARLELAADRWPTDLLSRLLALHRADPQSWPLKAVHDECMTTFLGGHESTAATLTWWAHCIAGDLTAQGIAQAEVDAVLGGRLPTAEDIPKLEFVAQTLQETLRLYPAAPILLMRRATRDITLGGWQLPARTHVTIPLQLMHLDERWFADPHAWRPERFGAGAPDIPRGALMPFGAGPRVCLGQHLALTELTIIAAMLLQRFALLPAEGIPPPKPVLAISLRPEEPLRLRLLARGEARSPRGHTAPPIVSHLNTTQLGKGVTS
jgi:cytochrome P450